jgi:hypothetical protein
MKGSLCTAHKSNGEPCKSHPLAGTTVCRVHGGSAPQVVSAARRRILAVYDPVTAKLITIALGKKTKTSDAIIAIRDLMKAAEEIARITGTDKKSDRGVLWEEFMAVYRRRVPVAEQE